MIQLSLGTLQTISLIWLSLGAVVFVCLFFITAPFGRHSSDKWGPTIDNRLGWMIMEFPSFAIMLAFLVFGSNSLKSYAWVLFACWLFHYTNRTFVYSWRTKTTTKRIPLLIVVSAVFFNLMNAGLNGYYLAELAPAGSYDLAWLTSPLFLIGAGLLIAGTFVNWAADNALIKLRKPGETGYKIPQGWLFNLVACPNMLGEIIEWTGFALMAWNLPALTFLVWTLANLVPRAKNHLDWYRRTFPDFPPKRKALFPGLF